MASVIVTAIGVIASWVMFVDQRKFHAKHDQERRIEIRDEIWDLLGGNLAQLAMIDTSYHKHVLDDISSKLEQHAALHPAHPDGSLLMAYFDMARKDLISAEKRCKELTSKSRYRARALNCLGLVCVQRDARGCAEEFFDRAARSNSTDSERAIAYANRAFVRLQEGDAEGALQSAKLAKALLPHEPSIPLLMGDILLQLGNRPAAKAAYEESTKSGHAHSDAYLNLGAIASEQGRFREAEERLKQAIRLEPSNALAYARLGAVYLHGARHVEARQAIERAIDLDPDLDEILPASSDTILIIPWGTTDPFWTGSFRMFVKLLYDKRSEQSDEWIEERLKFVESEEVSTGDEDG